MDLEYDEPGEEKMKHHARNESGIQEGWIIVFEYDMECVTFLSWA